MRRSFIAGMMIVLGTAAPLSMVAQPVPPDGAELIRQMHDRYVGKWYRTLSFTQATQRRTPADTMVSETWYETMKLPGRLRIDVGGSPGDPVILYARDSVYVKRGARLSPGRPGRNPLLILGFDVYTQPVERSVGALRDEGFDLKKIHDGSWQGRRVFIVGATSGDTVSRQFWVDAERMVFVRMIGPPAPGQSGAEEVRFDAYQPAGRGWLSTLVTASRGGRLVQKEQYSDVKVDPPVSDDMLDPASLGRP